ncbi:hypothetical protein ACA910_000796 [Epithemia clementina (nom. ined.)]
MCGQEPLESTGINVSSGNYHLDIEYCTRSGRGLRGYWIAQELLTTFSSESKLAAVTLIPRRSTCSPTGVFRVRIVDDAGASSLLWDRNEHGGFPEAKDLKQLVRDIINPEIYLGHSDTATKQAEKQKKVDVEEVIDLSKDVALRVEEKLPQAADMQNVPLPNVAITYCTGCRWLLRAAYYAQELTATFDEEIHSLTLIPSRPPRKGGAFLVSATQSPMTTSILWDRAVEGQFPDTTELKERLGALLNPQGQHDEPENKQTELMASVILDDMDDEDAEEARKYFGVL